MIFKPSKLGFVLGLSSALVQIGCGDDDEPPNPPMADSSSSSSESSSSVSPFASSATDGIDGGSETSAGPGRQSMASSDAGTQSDAAVVDAGDLEDVGLIEGLSRDPETSMFAQLIVRAEMEKGLTKEGPFTVLAPTNRAFERLPDGYLAALSRKQVETLVRNHLLYEPQTSSELVAAATTFSVLDLSHRVTSNGKDVYLNGLTRIVAANIALRDDIVHIVDSVLTVDEFPGTLLEAVRAYPRLSEFASRLTEQDRTLLQQDAKTLFAPINGGFEGYSPTNTDGVSNLGYHVLDDKLERSDLAASRVAQTASGAFMTVSNADGLSLSDGLRVSRLMGVDLPVRSGEEGSILYVVDAPLVAPPRVDEVLAGSKGETFDVFRARLGEVAAPGGTGSLLDYLADTELVTVFAPTDGAFNRVPNSFQSNLAKVLGFHLIDGVVDSSRLFHAADAGLPDTLTASGIKGFEVVTVSDGAETRLLLDGMVEVKVRDVPAANGIVHIIDGVLVPQDVIFPGTTAEALATYPALSKVSAAVAESGLLSNTMSTLFAPFDWAFESVTSAEAFVQAHAMSPAVLERSSFGLATATSLAGTAIDVDSQTLTVRGVRVVRPDLLTQSGVVHIVSGEFAE